ncbi:DNA polymerase LigD, ligase domain protein, partial [Calderihabitans maritimus]
LNRTEEQKMVENQMLPPTALCCRGICFESRPPEFFVGGSLSGI